MTETDRAATLAHGDALWGQLRVALDELIDEPVNADGWTGKDVFAHFARWQQHTIDDLRALIAGQAPSPVEGDENAINNRWHEEDRTLSRNAARERCLRTRDQLRSVLMSLSDEQWDRFGRACSPDINGEHYDAHLGALPAKERAR